MSFIKGSRTGGVVWLIFKETLILYRGSGWRKHWGIPGVKQRRELFLHTSVDSGWDRMDWTGKLRMQYCHRFEDLKVQVPPLKAPAKPSDVVMLLSSFSFSTGSVLTLGVEVGGSLFTKEGQAHGWANQTKPNQTIHILSSPSWPPATAGMDVWDSPQVHWTWHPAPPQGAWVTLAPWSEVQSCCRFAADRWFLGDHYFGNSKRWMKSPVHLSSLGPWLNSFLILGVTKLCKKRTWHD